ncbi:RcnB family protein [Sphingomonas aerolata]|uniref:RcnB family protein n=1 Tax=Sphingomonas aerolata TaxID=185951 RepID=UPI002FDF3338
MRMKVIVGLTLIMSVAGTTAEAQRRPDGASRPGATYSVPARSAVSVSPEPAASSDARRGSSVDGGWSAGANAPGGWSGYRRPYRGWALPAYWVAPRFGIVDWRAYGLVPPPPGYRWTRYFDDAVLIDARGSIFDTRAGVEWDGAVGGDAAPRYDVQSFDGRADDRVYARRQPRPVTRRTYVTTRVEAAPDFAGAAYRDQPLPPVQQRGGTWVSPDGMTTVTTTGGGYPGSDAYAGDGTTTVTVQSVPVTTTTTTTEYLTEPVTYRRTTPRRGPGRTRGGTRGGTLGSAR